MNLAGNAIKFTECGEIVLQIECQHQSETQATLRFAVIDTGIGIAEDHRAKIFQEFEQADASTTRRFGGTGLGLAISSRLVQLMEGRIWVESEIGKGSKFIFELPLQIDAARATMRLSEPSVNINNVRVLIVDDNATNRRILKDMLTKWGMNPVTTSGGAPALQALVDAKEEGDSFKVLISDVNMPDIDGLMLAKAVIEQDLLAAASVIMLTSGARPDDATELQALGITQHLLKPAKQSELYDAVVSSLNATGKPTASPQVSLDAVGKSKSSSELQILLVEDNLVNQKLALGILENLGHQVIVANNGKEALEKLDQHRFDLVLMDVQMPEMDGLAATRELRRREAHTETHVPVVAMTRNQGGPGAVPSRRNGRLLVQTDTVERHVRKTGPAVSEIRKGHFGGQARPRSCGFGRHDFLVSCTGIGGRKSRIDLRSRESISRRYAESHDESLGSGARE